MAKNDSKNTHLADTIANTFEWLITAFILAFVFRAFVMEAFRIPTGSMADTLKGAHFRLCCPECAFPYDYGFTPMAYNLPEEVTPSVNVPVGPDNPRCPSCGYFLSADTTNPIKMPVANGDRILVLKTLYQFREPDRWDVVVFKNPTAPRINFIKRLVGRPGETIQIIDGDVYINGLIARKPPKVQKELWMPVYNNDYQPVNPAVANFNGHPWRQPFENAQGSSWNFTAPNNPTVFTLNSPKGALSTAIYNTSVGNDFRDAYSYNEPRLYDFQPYVSDLKLSFFADLTEESGTVGIALSKYQTMYKASVDANGLMIILAVEQGKESVRLASMQLATAPKGSYVPVSFANIDHKLIFTCGDAELTKDLGRDPNAAGPRLIDIESQAQIFGSGKLALSHIALARDTHYTELNPFTRRHARGGERQPVILGPDDYFVCGDNSPNSHDSRWWDSYGQGNPYDGKRIHYRMGIVPRDYMVGKALFVYWPSGFKPFKDAKLAIVPNFGALRFIFGGLGSYN